jgi:ABC-type Fe3+ transport system permease subunit
VAAACLAGGLGVRALLSGVGGRTRRLIWAALLLPYLTPTLLTGYAYSDFSLSLARHPGCNGLLYAALVAMKLAPVAALVLWLSPAAFTAESVHCRRLLRCRERGLASSLSYGLFLARGPLRSRAGAFLLVFLLAFGEFEMASLLGIRTWTVSLFDAHAGGLALAESLRLVAVPLLFQFVLLVAAFVLLFGSRGPAAGGPDQIRSAPAGRWLGAAYLALAGLMVSVMPAFIVMRSSLAGFRVLFRGFVLGRDIAASLMLAGAAAGCAYVAAGWVAGPAVGAGRTRGRAARALWLCVPGLMGPLVLSLLVVYAFQTRGLGALYDTPVPLVSALCLVLLPLGAVVRALMRARAPGQSLHAASLLLPSGCGRVRSWGRRVAWELKTRPLFWAAFLLFCWGYFDLTASSVLAPSGMTPVSVRLYNLMHYGQSAALSAMVCAALAVPLLAALVMRAAAWLCSRVAVHG